MKGKVISGLMRGKHLIRIYKKRLYRLLGFKPFDGTLNVRIGMSIPIERYATMTLEHVLLDGSKKIELYLIPAILKVKEKSLHCWIVQQPKGPYHGDVLEIIHKKNLRKYLKLNDGDVVEVQLLSKEKKQHLIKKIFQLIKSLRTGD